MATINGTSGNDTLSTNLLQNDTINGMAGNDTYKYFLTGWDDTFYDTSGTDTIEFASNISYKRMSLFKDGNNLVIDLQGSGNITIQDHYLSTNNRIETLKFKDGVSAGVDYNLDLTAANLIVTEKLGTNNWVTPNGTSGVDIVFAGVGEERFLAAYGQGFESPTVFTDAGNDIIYSNYEWAVSAGEGNDTVYGHARIVWLSKGDDIFYGEPNSLAQTYVAGGDGNDTYYGTDLSDGNVFGDYENDFGTAITAPGNDTLYGYGGNDSLHGNEGNDYLYGGDDHDTMTGGSGDDHLYGDAGDDLIYAGDGVDYIYGGDGDDNLRGDTGNYDISGNLIYSSGIKYIYGDGGNDTIWDGLNNDILSGGVGNDFIVSNKGTDTIDAGDGNDTVSYGSGVTNTIQLGSGDDNISAILGAGQIVTVEGGYGDDVLDFRQSLYITDNGAAILHGDSGNDTYKAGVGYSSTGDIGDIIIEDSLGSSDKLQMAIYNVTYYSYLNYTVSGNDLIITSSFDSGSITLRNHFVPDYHIEYLSTFDYSLLSETTYNLVEFLTNSADTYTATTSTSLAGSNRNIIQALDGNDTVYAGAGDDIIYGGTGIDTLYGEAGNDWMIGDDGNDFLYGGTQNDTLIGAQGNDTLDGGDNDDLLWGDDGSDILTGGSGTDTAYYYHSADGVTVDLQNNTASGGFAQGDTLSGVENVSGSNSNDPSDRDWLYGNASVNVLTGNAGDDILEGGAGADTIDGGAGWDYARYTRSNGAISINLSTGVSNGAHAQGDVLINIEAIVGSDYNDTIVGHATSNYFKGGLGNDTITGGTSNDQIFGDAGTDTLKGGDGADKIYGGDDADILEGNNGDDTLYGGLGADSLKGSSGVDTFVWLSTAEIGVSVADTILDYNKTANEKLDISDLLSGYNPLTSLITDFVQITDNGTNSFLAVDYDGGANNFVLLATLNSVTGMTDEASQLAAARLVVV